MRQEAGVKNRVEGVRDLLVWQRSRALVKKIYEISKYFPPEERYGLMSQMRRAAVSIPSNIAEGFARHGTKDYISFISVAIGSAAELETQIILSEDLGFTTEDSVQPLLKEIDELQKMLHKLRQSLQSKL